MAGLEVYPRQRWRGSNEGGQGLVSSLGAKASGVPGTTLVERGKATMIFDRIIGIALLYPKYINHYR